MNLSLNLRGVRAVLEFTGVVELLQQCSEFCWSLLSTTFAEESRRAIVVRDFINGDCVTAPFALLLPVFVEAGKAFHVLEGTVVD